VRRRGKTRFSAHATQLPLHLIDGTESAVVRAYRTIRSELALTVTAWRKKPEIIALNKSDAIPKTALAAKRESLEKASGANSFTMFGVSGEGVEEVLVRLLVRWRNRAATRPCAPKRQWSP